MPAFTPQPRPMPTQVPATLEDSMHTCSPHVYSHRHASTYRWLPCHALYAPLSLHHAHVHASLTPPPLCLHIRIMYLMSLPHPTTACTHDHRMPVHISMPLPIDACAHNRHDAHDAHTMHTMLTMHTLHTMHTRCTYDAHDAHDAQAGHDAHNVHNAHNAHNAHTMHTQCSRCPRCPRCPQCT
jgi:hypothetical protein